MATARRTFSGELECLYFPRSFVLYVSFTLSFLTLPQPHERRLSHTMEPRPHSQPHKWSHSHTHPHKWSHGHTLRHTNGSKATLSATRMEPRSHSSPHKLHTLIHTNIFTAILLATQMKFHHIPEFPANLFRYCILYIISPN